ncbi:unnamed protein product [Heligmosomoides polygyrus]|uniref:ARS2 domain-containing protein n=1 Tax=Heligmosomoides polygyrus TaxID=6339 RepID=A0A3P8BMQ4_HELPZ|nr:unnamed protein product [Heligmosomoides polygyrus]
MTSFRGKPWTNLERWTLFTFYKRDSKEDWYGIPLLFRRFFHVTFLLDIVEQFRYTTSPPNGREVASGTTRISCRYARCADEMEATRKERIECRPKGYYTPADRKDAELYDDLMQNKLRLCFDYDEEELAARERMGAIYMKHLSELFYKEKEKKASKPRVSARPQTMPSQSNRDAQTARSLPSSPGRATLKSPVRPTKDATSETPPSVAATEDQTVEKMDVDEVESKSSENSLDSPRNAAEPKRPRGRPPKKMTSATPQRVEDSASSTRDGSPMQVGGSADDRNSPARSEGRRSCARTDAAGSSTSTTDKDNVHVVDSPAGRQSAEVVPTRVATAPTTGVTTDEFGGTGTQTSISIQMPLSSGGDADLSTSRKPSRSERRGASTTPPVAAAAATRCSASVQTGEMKWDLEDNIVVGWPLSDAKVAPLANTAGSVVIKSESMKTANCKTDQTSRIISWDSVLSGAYDKKIKETSKNLDRLHMWDVCYCNFSEEALQGLYHYQILVAMGILSMSRTSWPDSEGAKRVFHGMVRGSAGGGRLSLPVEAHRIGIDCYRAASASAFWGRIHQTLTASNGGNTANARDMTFIRCQIWRYFHR